MAGTTPTKRPKTSRLSTGFRPALTLHTFLVSSTTTSDIGVSKFIHGIPGLTLADFLSQFRFKHRLPETVMLNDMKLTIGDMVLGINLQDEDREWDWEALMIHYGEVKGLVKVVINA